MTTLAVRRDTAVAAVSSVAIAAVSLVLLVRVALHSSTGQRWDDEAMRTVVGGRDTQLTVLSVLGYISIGAIVAVVGVCAAIALVRGQARLAVAAVVVIGGANLTTQVLKHAVLSRPDVGFGTLNSLPSGHTTVVASAVGATLLVAPRVTRPVVALTGGFATTLTGASTVVAGWHRPADVLAALAVSLLWTAGVGLVLRGPAEPVAGTFASAVVGCAAAVAFLVVVGVRPLMGWDGFVQAGIVLGVVAAATAAFTLASAAVSPAD